MKRGNAPYLSQPQQLLALLRDGHDTARSNAHPKHLILKLQKHQLGIALRFEQLGEEREQGEQW